MSSKNFIIKNGLTIGSTEVINSSGIVQGSSVNEAIDDRVNALLTAGSGISLSYDDASNSLTITGHVGDITGVNAGDGLTGTATSGDATLNVGAGTGITVNADDIAVNMSAFDTDDLSEGTTNQYFTNERVDDRVNALLTAGSNVSLSYDDAAGTLTISATEDNLSNNDKIIFENYNFPLSFNKKKLSDNFESIIYFSFLNYTDFIKVVDKDKIYLINEIITIIPPKLKNLYFNLMKTFYQFKNESLENITYNFKFYQDYIYIYVIKNIIQNNIYI